MNDTSSDPNDTRLGSAGEEPDPYQLAADAAYQVGAAPSAGQWWCSSLTSPFALPPRPTDRTSP